MFTHDPYTVKAIEYLTGVAFLLLFVVFWRFVNGEPAAQPARAWSGQLAEWFRVPDWAMFHPGHGWASADGAQMLTVGMDDFAQQLIGPVDAVDLPAVGTQLTQGGRGWTIRADGKAVEMLSPVGGTVMAVNTDVGRRADLVNSDPYGRGWLLKIQVPQVKAAARELMQGPAARAWIAKASDALTASMTPELGLLCQDGGLPVHGIARGIDEQNWDEFVRRFLLTDGTAGVPTGEGEL